MNRAALTGLVVANLLVGLSLSGLAQSMSDHSGYQHSFEHAEAWAKQFDDPARDSWQKPAEVLDALHLEPTARVADLGAGTGYFSAQIAKRISWRALKLPIFPSRSISSWSWTPITTLITGLRTLLS
jgi:hypothetical protein